MNTANKRLGLAARLVCVAVFFVLGSVNARAFELHNNVGAGIGIPYGLFGAQYELELGFGNFVSVSPTIGAGTSLLAGAAVNGGVQLLLGNKDGLFRYGLTYWYGTNTIVESRPDHFRLKQGSTVGAKARFQFGRARRHAVDAHVLTTITPTKSELEDDGYSVESGGNNVLLGVGYVFRF